LPGEIRAQAVGRTEAGTFADQNHGHSRSQHLADLVADCDAALFDDRRPARLKGAPIEIAGLSWMG
jgi:hypothetical protein